MRRLLAKILIPTLLLCTCAQAERLSVDAELNALDAPLATAIPLATVSPAVEDTQSAFSGARSVEITEAERGAWQNILLLGGDSRRSDSYGRTDSMIIISVNREESLVKMTSIMRDTWVEIPGHNKEKINAANVFGGPELAMEIVNQSFGTDIEDYVMLNMDQMGRIVDLLGGVYVDVSAAEKGEINNYAGAANQLFSTGNVRLNGAQAVAYSRIRSIDNDYKRVMRQQEVLLSMAESAQNMEVDELMDITSEVSEIVLTSLDEQEMEDLAKAFMVMETEDVEQFRIPADGTFESGMFDGTWMIRPDFEKNCELLNAFIYG